MLLLQRSYYPIIPHNVNDENDKIDKLISVDLRKLNHPSMTMNIIPDIMLTCSQMNQFAKKINSTLFINPGSIYKGNSLCSLARISVFPPLVR